MDPSTFRIEERGGFRLLVHRATKVCLIDSASAKCWLRDPRQAMAPDDPTAVIECYSIEYVCPYVLLGLSVLLREGCAIALCGLAPQVHSVFLTLAPRMIPIFPSLADVEALVSSPVARAA